MYISSLGSSLTTYYVRLPPKAELRGYIDLYINLSDDNSIVSDITELYPRATETAIYQKCAYYVTSKIPAGTKFNMIANTC